MKRLMCASLIAGLAICNLAYAEAAPSVTVGRYNPENQQFKVYEKRLKKTFKDGGKITGFKIIGPPNKARLVRMGKNASGHCRTEMIPVRFRPSTLEIDFTVVTAPIFGCYDNDEFECSSQADKPWQRTECRYENSGGSYGCECWYWQTNDVVSISLPDTKCELRRGPPETYDYPDIVLDNYLP